MSLLLMPDGDRVSDSFWESRPIGSRPSNRCGWSGDAPFGIDSGQFSPMEAFPRDTRLGLATLRQR